jgi:hypothetical protein
VITSAASYELKERILSRESSVKLVTDLVHGVRGTPFATNQIRHQRKYCINSSAGEGKTDMKRRKVVRSDLLAPMYTFF